MDSYFKNINMLFYSVFSLVKSFLCLLYTTVVCLFWCGGVGWLGYSKRLRLVAMLIKLFIWEFLWVVAKFIGVFIWELLQCF